MTVAPILRVRITLSTFATALALTMAAPAPLWAQNPPAPAGQPARRTPPKNPRNRPAQPAGTQPNNPPQAQPDGPQTSPDETTAQPPALPPPVQEQAQPQPTGQPNQPNEPVGRDETGRVRIDPELQKRIDDMLKQDATRQGAEQPAGGTPGSPTPGNPPVNPAVTPPAGAENQAVPPPGSVTPDSMKTPAQRAAERRRARNAGADGANANAPGAQPNPGGQPGMVQPMDAAAPPEPPGETTVLQIEPEPEVNPVPLEQRQYGFSIKNGTYEQLIKGFAHQTGLGVLGEAPKDGVVTFETTETLGFQEALSRIRMLLFNYKPHEPYWMRHEGTHLRVIRVTDLYRVVPIERMYRSMDEFDAANLPDDEIALVIYTPQKVSFAEIRQARDFLPDYVRITPLENGTSVSIFALVSDIKKFVELLEKTRPIEGGDPRVSERFDVHNISASQAVDRLRQLADLDNARAATAPVGRGARGASPQPDVLTGLTDPLVILIPDDAQNYILVRGMPNKIEEIRKLLPFVDVAADAQGFAPVVVKVQHADAGDLVNAIQQVLSASSAPAASMGAPPPATPSPRRNKKSAGGGGSSAVPVSADSITLFPHPTQNAILVMADEAGVNRVRELVAMFDLKSVIGPLRIQLEVADATEVVSTVTSVLGGGGGGGGGPKGAAAPAPESFTLVPDPSGSAIWYSGTESELETVQDLIKILDIPGSTPSLHIVQLVYQAPSFVADILRQFDGATPQAAAPADAGQRPKSRRVKSTQSVSKFTPEDTQKKLYILCTADDFTRYQEIIAKLDQPENLKETFVRVPVTHIDATTAVDKLATTIPNFPVNQDVRTIAVDGSVLLVGASPYDVNIIKTILAEFDKPSTLEHRTFVIKHADPADIKLIIESLVGGGSSSEGRSSGSSRRRGRNLSNPATTPDGGAKPAAAAAPAADVTVSDEMTITQIGNQLIVKATPILLDRVAAVIAEFDVPSTESDMRVYADFPPNSDILSISETLTSVFAGGSATGRGAKAGGDGPRFIPQPASNRLVVMAEPADFTEIEKLLNVLRVENKMDTSVVEFVKVQYAEPAALVEEIRPLLDMKVRGLVESGEVAPESTPESTTPTTVPRPGRAKRIQAGGGGGGEKYHIGADAHNERIVIAAPQRIVDEAKHLIAQFDVPPTKATIVMRTVEVMNSTPAEMVKAVKEMIGKPSGGTTPRRPAAAKAGAPAAPGAAPAASSAMENLGGDGLVVMEAPGGAAVLLRGTVAEVDQAEDWIKQLDAMSTTGRSIKLFQIENADLEMLFDLIVSVVETAPAARTPAVGGAARRPTAGGKSTDDDDEDEFATTRTHASADTYLHADLIKDTLLVATTASKLKEIDTLVNQFETDKEIAKSVQPTTVPKFVFKLEHADQYDAQYDLEDLFEAIWDGDKPQVEKLFDDSLVIRYPDESKFEEIRELIRVHIDKPSEKQVKIVRKSYVPPPGLNARDVAIRIKQDNPDWDIELEDIGSDKPQDDFELEKLAPLRGTNGTPNQGNGNTKPTATPVKPTANGRVNSGSPPRFPAPFQMIADLLAATAIAQAPPEEEQNEPPAEDEAHEEPVEETELIQPEPQNLGDELIRQAIQNQQQSKKPTTKAPESEDKPKAKPKTSQKLKVYYDPVEGVILFEGAEESLDSAEEWLDELKDEKDKFTVKPDIRIYRVRYIDVYTAQDIIEEMFNATKSMQANFAQQQAQQQAAMRAQQQQQLQQQRQQQQQNQRGGPEAKDGQRPGQQPQQPQQQMAGLQMPQLPAPAVRVYPNPRDRTLILRAETSQYPQILELLATIDQPKPVDSMPRTYPLKRVSATDMEQMLRETLRLDEAGSRPRSGARAQAPSAAGGPAGPSTSPGGALPQTILQQTFTGSLLGVDPQDITLFSSETANTIMAVAPPAALDYIGSLIEQFESGDIPERITRFYLLEHASVTDVAAQLEDYFAAKNPRTTGGSRSRPRRGGDADSPAPAVSGEVGGGLNAPSFIAYDRLNQLTVHGTQEQIDEVESVLTRLDVASEEDEWQDVALTHADAKVVADTLSEMFGGGGSAAAAATPARPGRSGSGQSGGNGAKFIGESGGRMVFFSAPKAKHAEILSTIAKIEEKSQQTSKPRVIELKNAVPTQVAEAIEKAYDSRRSGGAQGGSSPRAPRFTITGHDPSRRVFVVADDDMFTQIESLITTLDVPGASMIAEFRIYPLQYANARAVHGQMSKLMTDYIQRLGASGSKNMEAFSVQPDDTANALIVLGSPSVFGFIEENLRKIDTPASAASKPEVKIVQLKNADPDAVTRALTEIFVRNASKSPEGEPSISISAASGSKAIMVRANAVDFARIQAAIAELDTEDVATAGEVRVVTINFGDASEIKTALESYLSKPAVAGGSRSGQLIGDVRLAVMPQTNSIMLSGDKDTLDRLEGIARGMDIAGEKGSVPQIIQLKFASAALVVPALRETFSDPKFGGGRKNYAPPVIVADEGSNALIVRAAPQELAAIEGFVAKLDIEGKGDKSGPRIVQVAAGINIEDLAAQIEESVNESAKARMGNAKGATVPSIIAIPNLRTSTITLAGNAMLFDEAESMIKALEKMGPAGGKATAVISAKNIATEDLQRLIDQLTQQQGSGGSRRGNSGGGSQRAPRGDR